MRTQLILIVLIIALFTACSENAIPKPKAYFRIDLEEKKYTSVDSIPFPFEFKLPQYAHVNLNRTRENKNFLNVDFPKFGARIHMSYIPIDTSLSSIIEESRSLVYKHVVKAQDIRENRVENPENKVYGVYYEIDGNAATGSQFFLTDSSTHFLRGALYFNVQPNFDSIQPVLNCIKQDIEELIVGLKWKESKNN